MGDRPDSIADAGERRRRAVAEALRGDIGLRAGAPGSPGLDPDLIQASRDLVLDLVADPREVGTATRRLRRIASRAAHMDIPLHYLVEAATGTARMLWRSLGEGEQPGDLAKDGDTVLTAVEVAVRNLWLAYADADRELAASQAEARRAFLDELLVAPPMDRLDALRRRRRAERHGLTADETFRLTLISAGMGRPEQEVESMTLAIRRGLGTPRAGRRLAFALPEIVEWRGRAVVLELANVNGDSRVRTAFDQAGGASGRRGWVAVAGPEVGHVDLLASSMERLRDAVRTAERVGRTGWIPNADELDLETLLSLDEGLRNRAVIAELGPILGDARMGSALLETLGVYFAVGHNAREAARRLHLAPRTVAYRLQRVEDLLGHRLDSGATLRLSVALFAYQLEREAPGGALA
jgi:hypothetical protein